MEVAIDKLQTKELLRQIVLELFQDKQGDFYEMVVEAIEEIGLANAIREGRRNEFVSEEQITTILAGQA